MIHSVVDGATASQISLPGGQGQNGLYGLLERGQQESNHRRVMGFEEGVSDRNTDVARVG